MPVHSVHHDTVQTETALESLMAAPASMLSDVVPPTMVQPVISFNLTLSSRLCFLRLFLFLISWWFDADWSWVQDEEKGNYGNFSDSTFFLLENSGFCYLSLCKAVWTLPRPPIWIRRRYIIWQNQTAIKLLLPSRSTTTIASLWMETRFAWGT